MSNDNKRLFYIDVLNCIAIFGVIVQHTSQIAQVGDPLAKTTIAGLILTLIFNPAVGLFFMNSGAMLLDYRERESTSSFLRKRICRVFIPFLFWSLFFYIYSHFFYLYPGIKHRDTISIYGFLKELNRTGINTTFWFFYIILQLYFATPVFSIVAKYSKRMIAYTAYIGIFYTFVVTYFTAISGIKVGLYGLYVPLLAESWMPFYALGYLFKINYFSKKQENVFIVMGAFTFLFKLVDIITVGNIKFINGIDIIFYTLAIHLLIKRYSYKFETFKTRWLFKKLSSASLGIYILHLIFIELLDWIFFHGTPRNWERYLEVLRNPIHILVWPVVIYLMLVIIIINLKKIKIIRYIIP